MPSKLCSKLSGGQESQMQSSYLVLPVYPVILTRLSRGKGIRMGI